MLTDIEAKNLMDTFIDLREKSKHDETLKSQFRKHEQLCLEKFKYIITMKASRYKSFSNYEDLIQEGFEALCRAMKNYNPNKGNVFWWFHKYIDTKISRSANLHSTIRYPLKVAKEQAPHREFTIPILIAEGNPESITNTSELINVAKQSLNCLSENNKKIISLYFGFQTNNPYSINKICQEMKITRAMCMKGLRQSLEIIAQNIKI